MARRNEITNSAFAEIMAPSASSSTPRKSVHYDVFLNHRGPDTKHTVAASIYRALKLMGVDVFLDEAELDLGDSIPCEIQHAIATSFLHIAILSPRYAESTWCLEELSLMHKTGQTIIPLFYNVDINHIRWLKGSYAKAFSEHEAKKRYRPEKVEDWKSALQKVSYLKGHIVNSKEDKEVLKIIANYVLKHPKRTPFVVAEYPMGLDKILRDFKRSVLETSESVKIVGITGMGGCGKTTLAKEYYNKMIESFYRCSFVCDARDAPTKKLYEKQKKMFQDLGGSKDISFDNVIEGKAIIAEYLRLVQVFIISDNVDHQDQLESLLPNKNNLAQGSVVVVISQDPGILISWGVPPNSIYKMEKLNSRHAMKLFCCHAFQQPSPIDEFEYLVKKFLIVCKGLPLSIKVLGALVHGKSKEYWSGQLDKFSRSLHTDIKTILVVSFDALEEDEKEIFLDISCFFIGTRKNLAITVWEESGWSGVGSVGTLVDKCLVEVDEQNCLKMHDLLRDLGKDISKTWSPYRLWSPQQITHIENQGKESVLIRGIKAQTDEFYEEFVEFVRESGRGIKRRRGFKIVDVENNYFTEELATLSEGLVLLRWANFPHRALPSWISLKKLRALELCEASKLEEPWSEIADPPVQLRVLKIIDAGNFLRFPRSIRFLKHLKEIFFDGNGAPIECLPDEFCCLQSLESLELVGCHKLKSLPSKIGNLTNLQKLRLQENSGIEDLPEEFGCLQSLKNLGLWKCDNLKSLPSKLGNLTTLRVLTLWECKKLMITSEALLQLTSLEDLDISDCPGPTEFVIQPECFSSSSSRLEYLSLNCSGLSKISISPHCYPNLQILQFTENDNLVEIDSLPIAVKKVDVYTCSSLQTISLNCGLVKLEELHMWDCKELLKIKGLENCSSLETLILDTWGKVAAIESLKDMERLRRVKITAACHISALEPCLQSLNREKWPSECEICVPTKPGVEAIVESFSDPGITLVNSFDRQKSEDNDCWEYVFLEERSANAAAMICLVINSNINFNTLKVTCVINSEEKDYTYLKQGKLVYMGVFTPSSLRGREVAFSLQSDEADLIEMGILVMGEENGVVDAFHELVQHLGKAHGICEV